MAASTALQVLVSPLLGTVYDSLRSVIENEFIQISGVGEEFQRLSDILLTVQDVLEDAEVKQLKEKPIRNWLRKLKDVAYDVEDFLDECAIMGVRTAQDNLKCSSRFYHIQEFLTGSVPSILSIEPSSSSSHTIAERIERFIDKFGAIAEQRYKFHLNPYVAVADPQSRMKQLRETTSKLINEQQVYGRDQDAKYIVNQLLNHISENGADHHKGDVLVYPIVGLGGLGKTTLAQMIYQDDKIKEQYQIRSWVCVSENVDPKALFKAIIQSCGESAQDIQSLDLIQSRLEDILNGNRFLIVLDDVWNEDQAEWEILKSSLRSGAKGSSIIVTTRLATVASIMSTVPPYYPGTLSHENCWNLFKHRAFASGDEETTYPKLEEIGREIVKKCGGIPLAAKALGGLLRFKRDEKQWLFLKYSEIWELDDDASDAILPALRLSYNNLPPNSKQCFVFCSVFPKHHKFVKEELIYLWMANGFLRSKGGIKEPEEVGDEIFSDLCMRSFFQDFEKDEEGNTIVCKMHDLVHDLACSTMRDECSVLWEDGGKGNAVWRPSSCSTTTHLSMVGNSSESFLAKTSPRIRTLVRLPVNVLFNESTSSLGSIFSYLKCLRVLDLRNSDISEIPDSIGTMIHLRYLNLSFTKIKILPNEYFCGLINLQILKLRSCSQLASLPRDMSKLINLRHLDIKGCYNLAQMPPGMGKLNFLRTLSVFIVGTRNGCGIGELKDLNHLQGNLMIKGLEQIETSADASTSNLVKKKNLQSLELCWSWFSGAESEEKEKKGC
ncbi:hypothetical protein MKW92_022823 [Papaver armeniacum]|nr:hypothetical protein MKW92_022823 [Papaver armeniacum]